MGPGAWYPPARADVCPNCGARGYSGDECSKCWWSEDQDFFCPHWMDVGVWRLGMESGWEPLKKKGKK